MEKESKGGRPRDDRPVVTGEKSPRGGGSRSFHVPAAVPGRTTARPTDRPRRASGVNRRHDVAGVRVP